MLEDLHGNRSTIATSQLPIAVWHEAIGDPTLADAILDRLIHNAYKINMRGESMRKRIGNLTTTTGFVKQYKNPRRYTPIGGWLRGYWVAVFLEIGWSASWKSGG